MSESENDYSHLQFAASINPAQQERFKRSLDAVAKRREQAMSLSEEEKEIVEGCISRIVSSLQSCLPEGTTIRPITTDNFLFIKTKYGDAFPSGSAEMSFQKIRIKMKYRVSKTPRILLEAILAHEIIHYMTKAVVLKPDVWEVSRGYPAYQLKHGLTRYKPNKHVYTGLMAEPMAELFTLYHLKEDVVFTSTYIDQIRFVVAMIEVMAQRQQIDPVKVFQKFLTADLLQDYSFQAELVSVFESDFVKKYNRTVVNMGQLMGHYITDSEAVFADLAATGGFGTEWGEIMKPGWEEDEVGLQGLKGKFKKELKGTTYKLPWKLALRQFFARFK